MTLASAVDTAVGGGAVVLIGTFLTFFNRWMKRKNEAGVIASRHQHTEHVDMGDLNDRLMKRLCTVEDGLAECQEHHRECEERAGKQQGEIDGLRRDHSKCDSENKKSTARIASLENAVAQLTRRTK